MLRTVPATVLTLLMAWGSAHAMSGPVRRGQDGESVTRRRGLDPEAGRRGKGTIEGARKLTRAEELRKARTKTIRLLSPPRCGTRTPGDFRSYLLHLQNPSPHFYVEVWGNRRVFYVQDEIIYYLRSNRTAYVTLFWIGPEGSVFIPFTNLKVEADRDHRIDPSNIIVEPVGLERWRVIATLEPHALPCRVNGGRFLEALKRLQAQGPWAVGRWDVMSKVLRRHKRRLRWRR